MHEPQVDDKAIYRILSLDGGGIRGVFPVAFLARLEEHLDGSIGSHFDLIAGTSTGGVIAIGLGLGLSACDILRLYEDHGAAIFDQQHGRDGDVASAALARRAPPVRLEILFDAPAERLDRHLRAEAPG